ncbi:TPA: hypothetical protein RJR38_002720 [Burkholderia multivorans]|nr:hypothetical protein [Burkholderia multivorans]
MTTENSRADALTLSEDRIDWIANAHCPGGTAYPSNVKNAIREALREARATSANETGVEGAPVIPIELSSVAETVADGTGFWRSCSGCHETNEGHETGHYTPTARF